MREAWRNTLGVGVGGHARVDSMAWNIRYSRSPKNPALQLLQKSSKSASTTPQRPIWNTFGTVSVRDFWENDCRRREALPGGMHSQGEWEGRIRAMSRKRTRGKGCEGDRATTQQRLHERKRLLAANEDDVDDDGAQGVGGCKRELKGSHPR